MESRFVSLTPYCLVEYMFEPLGSLNYMTDDVVLLTNTETGLPKILPNIITQDPLNLDLILEYSKKGKEPMHKRIIESESQLQLNQKLMDLKNPPISGEIKLQISRLIKSPINLISRNNFVTMYNEDQLGKAIDMPDLWLKEHFTKLNTIAKQTYE